MKKLIIILLTTISLQSFTLASAVDYGEELQGAPQKQYNVKFSDVKKDYWAFNYIAELVDSNVISGYPDGLFRPENLVLRSEFAKIMIGASGLKVEKQQASSFADVSTDEWYSPYVETSKSYLTGFNVNGVNMYLPNKAAIREDIAIAMVRLKGYDTSVADIGMIKTMFSDFNSISSNAQPYVAVAVERGIISGYPDGTFRGQQTITRAEAATLLWRANQYGNDNKVIDSAPQNTIATTTPTIAPSKTQQPMETPQPVETQKPTPIPTKAPELKPYVVDTLVETSSSIWNPFNMSTIDNDNNIYYYEKDDNVIYKFNALKGSKKEFLDVSEIIYQVTEEVEKTIVKEVEKPIETDKTAAEQKDNSTGDTSSTESKTQTVKVEEKVTETIVKEEYKDFEPSQIYYDDANGRILLSGKFTKQTNFKGYEDKDSDYYAIFDITGKPKTVGTPNNNKYGIHTIGCTLKNGTYLSKDARGEIRNLTDLSYSNQLTNQYGDTISLATNTSNGVFILTKDHWNSILKICKVNFSTSEVEKVNDEIIAFAIGNTKDNFYFWEPTDGIFIKSDETGKLSKLKINTNENVEVLDYKVLPTYNSDGFNARLYPVNDDMIVFYDSYKKCFRIIKKR